MISTFLVEYPWLTTLALVLGLVVGPLVGYLLVPHRRLTGVLTALSVVAVLVVTMYPEARTPQPGCEFSLPTLRLGAVESIANIILFIPPVLLAGVALRKPLLALAGGTVLSALIELLQLAVPAFGRSCDTSDWITNTIGAVVGAGLAGIALLLARRLSKSG